MEENKQKRGGYCRPILDRGSPSVITHVQFSILSFRYDMTLHHVQGGILFWLCRNKLTPPGNLPDIALKKRIMIEIVYKVHIYKFKGNYPFKQEFILINRKTSQKFYLKFKNWEFQQE